MKKRSRLQLFVVLSFGLGVKPKAHSEKSPSSRGGKEADNRERNGTKQTLAYTQTTVRLYPNSTDSWPNVRLKSSVVIKTEFADVYGGT